MAVSFVAAGSPVAAAQGSVTLTAASHLPAGIQNGDILVVIAGTYGYTGDMTIDNGYAQKAEYSTAATIYGRVFLAWKRTNGTEGDTVITHTDTANESIVAWIVAFRGCVDSGDPFDVFGSSKEHAADASAPYTYDHDAIETLVDGAMVLAFGSSIDNNTWGIAADGNLANAAITTNATSVGSDTSAYIIYGVMDSHGTSGTITAEQTADGGDKTIQGIGVLEPAEGGTTITAASTLTNSAPSPIIVSDTTVQGTASILTGTVSGAATLSTPVFNTVDAGSTLSCALSSAAAMVNTAPVRSGIRGAAFIRVVDATPQTSGIIRSRAKLVIAKQD